MREIKFRIWLPKINKMMYNEDLYTNKVREYEELANYNYPFDTDEIYPWYDIYNWLGLETDLEYMIPLQYTGLQDRNGKEMYEGDIVNYFKDEYAVIKWYRGGFIVESESQAEPFYDICANIEIVGNIFENLELLEKI